MLTRLFGTAILVILLLPMADFTESTAEAGILKNGVRPGDRSKMHIVRRPRPGQRKRIHAPGKAPTVSKPSARRGTPRGQRHGWFWKKYSVAASAARAGRWGEALATMSERRTKGQGIVRDETVQAISSAYGRLIGRAATKHSVSEALLIAVITVESRGQPQAVSPKGAAGLMQLIPATAKRFGVSNSFDTGQNISGGAAYLDWLLREFRGDVLLALAGYNAGEGAVRKHKGVPPYRETRDYVVKVMDALAAAQSLCPAPPSGPRVRCTLGSAGS